MPHPRMSACCVPQLSTSIHSQAHASSAAERMPHSAAKRMPHPQLSASLIRITCCTIHATPLLHVASCAWLHGYMRTVTWSHAHDYMVTCAWLHVTMRMVTWLHAHGYMVTCAWSDGYMRMVTCCVLCTGPLVSCPMRCMQATCSPPLVLAKNMHIFSCYVHALLSHAHLFSSTPALVAAAVAVASAAPFIRSYNVARRPFNSAGSV